MPVVDVEPRRAGSRVAAVPPDFGVGPPRMKAERLRYDRPAAEAGTAVPIGSAGLVVVKPGTPDQVGSAIPVRGDDSIAAAIGPARRRPGSRSGAGVRTQGPRRSEAGIAAFPVVVA